MNGTSWLAGMGWVKRLGVALAVLALWAPSGRAAETIVVTIVVTIPVEDAGEVISSDPKRLRLGRGPVRRDDALFRPGFQGPDDRARRAAS
jgi:hypothetical protein